MERALFSATLYESARHAFVPECLVTLYSPGLLAFRISRRTVNTFDIGQCERGTQAIRKVL